MTNQTPDEFGLIPHRQFEKLVGEKLPMKVEWYLRGEEVYHREGPHGWRGFHKEAPETNQGAD